MPELKVNPINQLLLLKQSTFKDKLCFLDEDIQNAQRAKAKNVTITTDYFERTVTIYNDGEVLDDPQKLFSIAESGWGDDTKKAENPFGIGFFSNVVVSDFITIHSGYKYITFDVKHMLECNDTEIQTQQIDEFVQGFKLTLHDFNFNECSQRKIKERVQNLANFIHELDIVCDDTKMEHYALTQWGEDVKFATVVENEFCTGWIGPATNYSWSDQLSIYYKGRYVTKLSGTYYLIGSLHINDNVLNLVAPDRKNIIVDEKLDAFKQMITENIKAYCNELITSDIDSELLLDYTNSIEHYIDIDAVKNDIKFVTFKTNDEQSIAYLNGIADTLLENDSIRSLKDYELFLKENTNPLNDASKDAEDGITIDLTPDTEYTPRFSDDRDATSYSGYGYHDNHKTHDPLDIIDESEADTAIIRGETVKNITEPIFYLKFSEIKECRYKLKIARHYNLTIILARNNVEYEVLQKMQTTDNGNPVVHINTLMEEVTVFGTLTNTNLTAKEKRAARILGMISNMFDYEENIFAIGDLHITKSIEIKSIAFKQIVPDTHINVLYSQEHDAILMDRSVLRDQNLTANLSSKLNISDMQFIMANIQKIAKAICEFNQINDTSYENVEYVEHAILELLSRYRPQAHIPNVNDLQFDEPEKRQKLSRKQKKRIARMNRKTGE